MNGQEALERIQALDAQIDALAVRLQWLADENRSLRADLQQLVNERSDLAARNDLARTRVEALIQRIRMLEDSP